MTAPSLQRWDSTPPREHGIRMEDGEGVADKHDNIGLARPYRVFSIARLLLFNICCMKPGFATSPFDLTPVWSLRFRCSFVVLVDWCRSLLENNCC